MTNQFINPSVVAKEALRQLKNNCVMGNLVYRGYEEEFKTLNRGWKVGSSVQIKAPVYFRTHEGRNITGLEAELQEQETLFQVNYWRGVAFKLNADEMTFNIDRFTQRFIKPAMQAIANEIDTTLLGLYKGVPTQVGVPGVVPASLWPYLQAHAKMSDHAVPLQDRFCVINPLAKAKLADIIKGLYHQPMVGTAVQQAEIPGSVAGFRMHESQNVQTQVIGFDPALSLTMGGTAAENATELLVHGNAEWTLNEGDIITVAGTNANNPISGLDLGYVRQFVVTENITSAGTTPFAGTVKVTPGTPPWNIRSNNADPASDLPYQTVVDIPTSGRDVDVSTVTPTTDPQKYTANLAFHRDCLGLCMVPIEIPASIYWKATESHEGYTISVVRYFNGDTLTETVRFDALFGVKVLNPFLGCRIAGANIDTT